MKVGRRFTFGEVFSCLTIAVAIFSLVSVTQRIFKVGFAPVFGDLIDFYRRLTYPAVEFLLSILPWNFPTWYKDCYVLSVLCLSLVMRTNFEVYVDPDKYPKSVKILTAVQIFIAELVLSVLLFGLGVIVIIAIINVVGRDRLIKLLSNGGIDEKMRQRLWRMTHYRRYRTQRLTLLRHIVITVGGMICFFAMNAYFN